MTGERVRPEEVSESEKHLVHATSSARGSIIGSYAQVEFTLADFAVKSTVRPHLAPLVGAFPYKREARLRAVLSILKREPFRRYRNAAAPLVSELNRWKQLRDMMAHGFLTIEVTPAGRHQLLFRLWEPFGGGNAQLRHLLTTLPQLEADALATATYAHRFVTLFRRIYLEQAVEGDI